VQNDPGWLFYLSVVVMVTITAAQIMFYRRKRWIYWIGSPRYQDTV